MALGIGQEQGALAEVVEHEAGERHAEPTQPDRQAAEMPHVRIHGFPARHRQEGGAEHSEADRRAGVDAGSSTACQGLSAARTPGRPRNAGEAEQPDGREPHQHDRAEDAADGLGPAPLHEEQADQDHDGQRHDEAA